jgi:hypothetical protein
MAKRQEQRGRKILGRAQLWRPWVGSDNEKTEEDIKKGRQTTVGLGQLSKPDPEKYGRELQELHIAARQQHYKEFTAMTDEELFATHETNRQNFLDGDIATNAYRESLANAVEARLMEDRFKSPIPMPSVHAVVGPGLPGPGSDYYAQEVYRRISNHYKDEDLGLTEYNPPFLPGENQESVAWQVRKNLGSEAQRRHALIDKLRQNKLNNDIQELSKGPYRFTPNPEPEPQVAAAAAPPLPPPDGPDGPNNPIDYPNKDDLKKTTEDYYKEIIKIPNDPKPNTVEEFDNYVTQKNKDAIKLSKEALKGIGKKSAKKPAKKPSDKDENWIEP